MPATRFTLSVRGDRGTPIAARSSLLTMSLIAIRRISIWSARAKSGKTALKRAAKVRITWRIVFRMAEFACSGSTWVVYERKVLERGGIRIEVCANREVEDALRYRPPDPPLADPILRSAAEAAASC